MKSFRVSFFAVLAFSLLIVSACNDDQEVVTPPADSRIIWSGTTLTFEKPNGGDPGLAVNQDRITDNVWITRGNNGGQIYNAVSENDATKTSSPEGTLWAIGTTDNIDNLTFDDFRTAVGSPKSVVGKDLVLLLVEENIAIDIRFTSWSGNNQGGFAYERSTQQ